MFKFYIVNAKQLDKNEISFLRQERIEKANRFFFEKDRNLSLAAGIALKRAIEEKDLDYANIRIGYGENGKPFLLDYPNIHFNLSHTEEYAIAVISDKQIGCDIEKIRKYDKGVAERCFSRQEIDYVETSSDKDRSFTKVWTYKEGFLKAIGIGLSDKMKEITIIPSATSNKIRQNISKKEWNVFDKDFEDYLISIVEEK